MFLAENQGFEGLDSDPGVTRAERAVAGKSGAEPHVVGVSAGVHGGLTMVSTSDGTPLVLGDTPRVAAALCARADPGQVLLWVGKNTGGPYKQC